MEGATFLTRVVLENYKSIAHCDVQLGPLNYLVGPNGAGKSNFLDGVRFVADALEHSVGHALRNRGGAAAVCHAAPQQQGYFRIHLEFTTSSGTEGHYMVKVGVPAGASPSAPWEVLEEAIGRGPQPQHLPNERSFFRDRFALALMADEPTFREVYAALTRMRFYNIGPRSIKDFETFDPSSFLSHDGSNLASVFARLEASSGDPTERINEYLRLVLPGLVRVRAEPVFQDQPELAMDSQKVALLFEQRFPAGTVRLYSPLQMSEGTLRSLGILTALFQAAVVDAPKPSLVAIEEPEAQVHPAVLAVLRDALLEASYSTQVLVTTQSADLLDSKDIETDMILAVTADEGTTRIAPINAGGRDLIRRRLYTVGELLRIGQLAPEKDVNGRVADGQPAPVGGTS